MFLLTNHSPAKDATKLINVKMGYFLRFDWGRACCLDARPDTLPLLYPPPPSPLRIDVCMRLRTLGGEKPEAVVVDDGEGFVQIEFTPTIPHCR